MAHCSTKSRKWNAVWYKSKKYLNFIKSIGYRIGGPSIQIDEKITITSVKHSENNIIASQKYDISNVLIDPYGKCIIGRKKYGQLGQVSHKSI